MSRVRAALAAVVLLGAASSALTQTAPQTPGKSPTESEAVPLNRIERRAGQPRDDSRLEFFRAALKRMSHNSAEASLAVEGDEKSVAVDCGKVKQESADFARLESLAPGQLLTLEGASAIKLRTELTLLFGDVAVGPGNLAPDWAGLYSLWLGKNDAGEWRLRFNGEPDVWGTMHDPAADLGEVALEHSLDPEKNAAELTPLLELEADEGTGRLALEWGPHRFATAFVVQPEAP